MMFLSTFKKLEDNKVVIRNRRSKDRTHTGQRKKEKRKVNSLKISKG